MNPIDKNQRLRCSSTPWHSPIAVALVTIVLFIAPPSHGEGIATRRFDDFISLRTDLSDMVSVATTRVWLVSDFLSDGDLVAALYMAKYRKIDVQVMLGQARANNYMSRMDFLRKQGIPVFLKPDKFPDFGISTVLIDEKFLTIDSPLDFMIKDRQFTVTYENYKKTRQFMESFADATNLRLPIELPPTRTAIRAHTLSERAHQFRSGASKTTPSAIRRREDAHDTYYYRGASPKRPSEVPAALPKKTKWQLKLEKPFNQDQNNNHGSSIDNLKTPK